MRHPLVPALLVVLALFAYVLLGAAVAGASPAGVENATVAGTVTDDDGAAVEGAYVLLEPEPADRIREATGNDRNVAEYLFRYGMADPDGVWVARTDADGRYHAEVPSGDYAVVAVAEADWAVSRLREVTADGETGRDLSVDPERVQAIEGEEATVEPGAEARLTLELTNTDDEPVRSPAVGLESLPDGWTLVGVETDGTVDPDDRTVTWESVAPGETAAATVTVAVPEDAEPGRHDLSPTVDGRTHFVELASGLRVSVEPPGWTPTEPGTPHHVTDVPDERTDVDAPAGESGADERTESPDAGDERAPATPGFGVGVAALALATAAALLRRTESR